MCIRDRVDCLVVVIHRDSFTRCCAEYPEIWGLIAHELACEVGLLLQQTVDSSLLSAEERVARFFIRRYAEGHCQVTDEGVVMELSLIHISMLHISSGPPVSWLPWATGRST